MTMSNPMVLVRISNNLRNTFDIEYGLKTGDGRAPLLSKPTLKTFIWKLSVVVIGSLFYESDQIVHAALTLCHDSPRLGGNFYKPWQSWTRNQWKPEKWHPSEKTEYWKGHSFIYARNWNLSDSDKIRKKIPLVNKAFYSVLVILKVSYLHRSTRLRSYKSHILSTRNMDLRASIRENADGF